MDKENEYDEFKELLQKYGLKATAQRRAVHGSMVRLGHASADQVVADLAEHSDVKITLASVYNVLTDLSDKGIYSRRMSQSNKMFFDVTTKLHAHIYDTENDSYKDIFDEELEQLIHEHFARKRYRGFKIEGIDVQVLVRPSTRKKRSRE